MISKIIFAITILASLGVAWILNSVTPSSIGPVGVMGFFVLLYAIFVGVFSFVLYGGFRLLQLVVSNFNFHLSFKNRNYKFFLKYSLILAFAPIILIAQQSAGGVGIIDIILLIIFQILSMVIISKR